MKSTNNIKKSLPTLKKICIIGNGGRENALAWAFKKAKTVEEVFVIPGNGGTKEINGCKVIDIIETNVEKILKSCLSNAIDLVVIGPEAPLASGLADKLREGGLTVFGPGATGAQLESSKEWAKELMRTAGVPTANYWSVRNIQEALAVLKKVDKPLVVKANGLAAGKGVTVPDSLETTKDAIQKVFEGHFGNSGNTVILEEILEGPEVSIFALCDGEEIIILPPAQDHKRLKDGDKGPNTGGMGAYAPTPVITANQLKEVNDRILRPTLKALKTRDINYRGVIYAGLMLTSSGPYVIEFNCRFGDPECQALMPLLGPEIAEIIYACALGRLEEAPKLSLQTGCSACVVAATSGYPENPRKGDHLRIKRKETDVMQIFHAGTKIDLQGNLITSGGRVLSVVAQAEDFDNAFSIAYEGMKQVDFKGMFYRTEIGYQVRKQSTQIKEKK